MDAQTQITLDQFYAAVTADIQAAFPAFVTVEFDREDRKEVPLPAVLLEISEFDDANEIDPGTEQWATTARVEAYVILGFRTAGVKLEVRKAATALAVWLRKRRFHHPDFPGGTLPSGEVQLVGAYKDDFEPELDQFEVWRVEWHQVMHLGATAFPAGGTTPSTPLFSWAPEIGNGHADDYTEALPPTPTP